MWLEEFFIGTVKSMLRKAAQPEWLGPDACITSAMAVQSQVAAASTQERLRADVAAAVAGKEAGLSPSARLGVTCLCPQDFAHRNPVPAHPIFSSLHLAKWVASVFVFLSQERKTVVCYTAEKPEASCVGRGGQRAVLVGSLQLPGRCLRDQDWQHFRLPQHTYVSWRCPQPTLGQDLAVQNFPHLAWSCRRPGDGDLRAHSGSAASQHWQLVAYICT